MRIYFIWIIFMILPYVLVTSLPVHHQESHQSNVENIPTNVHLQQTNAHNIPKPDESSNHDEQIISVRITSSVAVGRSKAKSFHKTSDSNRDHLESEFHITTPSIEDTQPFTTTVSDIVSTVTTTTLEDVESKTELPPSLAGANMEFLKQLQAKKGIRGLNNYERQHSFNSEDDVTDFNQTNDSVAESSIQSVFREDKLLVDVPLARSVPLSYGSKNYIQDPPQANSRLTTVNFNVVHDTPKINNYNDHLSTYINPTQSAAETQEYYNQPSKIYSQPAQIYSEPAKIYSEPAKIYSEPAKVYSEPAKIYSEPAKIYSEPAKFYSQPASLHLNDGIQSGDVTWQQKSSTSGYSTLPTTSPSYPANAQRHIGHEPEKNYEVDEKVSVMTDGQTHGEQPANPENCKQENCKVGYVVEGRQFRKYRVEERTPDGFIVGEYGVVRNEDGALRGVRYTADSDASPRLIHDALMKFLQLK
ncbi:uncharacterized protein LOC120627222 [Pararge aegeria]|uniref:Jg4365 protein n=1 Tax=Pararge aegeria aegeria TaxID=348720 RepID=A0A8S4RPJ2_9NEOP|nr:uncharacterized protein LOC120627222 [Pararge aegeria]CAH2238691.1 jg4365 [Pararge aegeria aegeria]